MQGRVALLLSGGIDSATTLAVYFRQKAHIDAIFFDYGQPARRSEWGAAQAIAAHYNVNLRRVRLGIRLPVAGGEFFARNAILVLAMGALIPERPLVIAAGLHNASPYYDTTSTFVCRHSTSARRIFQRLYSLLSPLP
jgi:hypothetical protein